MRASDPRPAPVPTKRRRLRTHGMDEAGGIRLPAGADVARAKIRIRSAAAGEKLGVGGGGR
jgi:hypothetical protein